MRHLNRLPHFCRTFDWSCRIIPQKCDTNSNVELGVGIHAMVKVVILKFKQQYSTVNLYRVTLT